MNFKDFDYKKITEDVDLFAKQHVKPSRYEHSVRVAQTCRIICEKNNVDANKAYFVGIAHDICKDFPAEQLIELAKKDGNPIIDFELNQPFLLHGRAAAIMLKEKFLIDDVDILEAVANHTSGVIGMCDLTKALFIADKIEPGRPQSTEDYRNNLLGLPLDKMFEVVLKENYNYLVKKGYKLYPGTEKMLDFYIIK